MEDSTGAFPAPAADAGAVLDWIYGEVVLRKHLGEGPGLPEYLDRFPQGS